jgi:hypothetical protein
MPDDPREPEMGRPPRRSSDRRPVRPRRPLPRAAQLEGRPPGTRRLPLLALIAGALIIAGLIDRAGATRSAEIPVPVGPTAAPSTALSSSWFCAGAGDSTPGSLVIANTQSRPVTATVDVLASQDPAGTRSGPAPAVTTLTVAPRSRQSVPEQVAGGTGGVGAIVTLDGGASAVEQEVRTLFGTTTTPCATSGSASWYFPTGTTLRNATDTLSLLNPYPAVAIADLTFVTDQGQEAPGGLQAVAVPGQSLVTVNLGDHLRGRNRIATTVTATTGRLVAWQTLTVTPPAAGTPLVGQPGLSGAIEQPGTVDDPASPVTGVTLTLGAPSAGTQWWWPDGGSGGGVSEQYVVLNPGSVPAELQLTIKPESGGIEVLPVTVAPSAVVAVSSNTSTQIPESVAYSASLTSQNGVPVVAERTITATKPSPRTGLGALLGGRTASARWLLAAGSVNRLLDEWVDVQNPGSSPVAVSIATLSGTPIAGLVTVPSGGHAAMQVAAPAGPSFDNGLVVDATGPVVVERDLYGLALGGVSLAPGVPLAPAVPPGG